MLSCRVDSGGEEHTIEKEVYDMENIFGKQNQLECK